jgi:hypothetical protein
MVGAFFILPYRVDAQDKALDAEIQARKLLEAERAADHDILIEIRADTKGIKERLGGYARGNQSSVTQRMDAPN